LNVWYSTPHLTADLSELFCCLLAGTFDFFSSFLPQPALCIVSTTPHHPVSPLSPYTRLGPRIVKPHPPFLFLPARVSTETLSFPAMPFLSSPPATQGRESRQRVSGLGNEVTPSTLSTRFPPPLPRKDACPPLYLIFPRRIDFSLPLSLLLTPSFSTPSVSGPPTFVWLSIKHPAFFPLSWGHRQQLFVSSSHPCPFHIAPRPLTKVRAGILPEFHDVGFCGLRRIGTGRIFLHPSSVLSSSSASAIRSSRIFCSEGFSSIRSFLLLWLHGPSPPPFNPPPKFIERSPILSIAYFPHAILASRWKLCCSKEGRSFFAPFL